MSVTVHHGDCLDVLRTMPDDSIACCVTSPPYYGLRDYGVEGQIGLEPTPDEYVAKLVAVFREGRRVLRDDGTLWLNLGDSYANDGKWGGSTGGKHVGGKEGTEGYRIRRNTGLKPKDLIGIPWLVAFALRADGWYLRSDIIWAKPNPMPESVRDRPTKAHEYVFLLSKRERYFWDAEAVAEPASYLQPNSPQSIKSPHGQGFTRRAKGNAKTFRGGGAYIGGRSFDNGAVVGRESHGNAPNDAGTRNIRTVWTIATTPFPEAHFATFPPELAERCIKAGSRAGDTVLDPFGGTGTVGMVADRLQRSAVLIELNPDYAAMARRRVADDAPLFAEVA